MADKTAFEIPEAMRTFADKSVDQARKAFDDFVAASVKAVDQAESSARSMQEGARDVNRQALTFMEENLSASFEFAQRMVRARTMEELQALQRDFVERQVASAKAQGTAVSEAIARATADVTARMKG